MNLSFDMLNIFYWVYSAKNITKAAEILYISQPAVSQSLKKMEEILGITLFVRTKRGVIPTDNAKIVFEYLKPAIECINNSEEKFSNINSLQEGSINIGCGTALTQTVLMSAITNFSKQYPNISINIDRAQTPKLLKNLNFGLLDIVIAYTPLTNEYHNIELYKSKTIQDCFFTSKSFWSSDKNVVSLKSLNNYPLILQQKNSHTRNFLDCFCKEKGVNLVSKFELASASLIKDFVMCGLGIGYLPENIVFNDYNDDLIILDLDVDIPPREIGVFIKSNSTTNICIKKFIELM